MGHEKASDEVRFGLSGHLEAKTASKNLLEKIRSFYEIPIFSQPVSKSQNSHGYLKKSPPPNGLPQVF